MLETLRIGATVATPLGFLGFVVALVYYIRVRQLKHKETVLEKLSPEERAKYLDESLSRYKIDAGNATRQEKIQLIKDEMEKRYRLAVLYTLVAAIVFVICFGLAVYAVARPTAPTSDPLKPPTDPIAVTGNPPLAIADTPKPAPVSEVEIEGVEKIAVLSKDFTRITLKFKQPVPNGEGTLVLSLTGSDRRLRFEMFPIIGRGEIQSDSTDRLMTQFSPGSIGIDQSQLLKLRGQFYSYRFPKHVLSPAYSVEIETVDIVIRPEADSDFKFYKVLLKFKEKIPKGDGTLVIDAGDGRQVRLVIYPLSDIEAKRRDEFAALGSSVHWMTTEFNPDKVQIKPSQLQGLRAHFFSYEFPKLVPSLP